MGDDGADGAVLASKLCKLVWYEPDGDYKYEADGECNAKKSDEIIRLIVR